METIVYLQQLVGKTVANTELITGTVIARKASRDEPDNIQIELTWQMYLEDYILNIYNAMSIRPDEKEFDDLRGLKVIAVDENKERAELIFDNGTKLQVDLRDEAYTGPEAMCLYGPDNLCVVWR